MVRSMTAFARQTFSMQGGELVVVVRSVNHRFFDLNLKLPESLQVFEWKIRNLFKNELKRGKIDCTFSYNNQQNDVLSLDETVLKELRNNHLVLQKYFPEVQVELTRFMNWPGLLKKQDFIFNEEDVLDKCVIIIDKLKDMQGDEGKNLAKFIKIRLDEIKNIVDSIEVNAKKSVKDYRNQLIKRVSSLVSEDIDRGILEQQIIYFAEKTDISEELDRLKAHVLAVYKILDDDVDDVGKKLDFLMQEFNREANTLSSKAANLAITESAVNLKVLIEQMREQVQNIL